MTNSAPWTNLFCKYSCRALPVIICGHLCKVICVRNPHNARCDPHISIVGFTLPLPISNLCESYLPLPNSHLCEINRCILCINCNEDSSSHADQKMISDMNAMFSCLFNLFAAACIAITQGGLPSVQN